MPRSVEILHPQPSLLDVGEPAGIVVPTVSAGDYDPFGEDVAQDDPRPAPGGKGFGKVSGRKDGRSGRFARDQLRRAIDHLTTRKVPTHVLPYAGGFYWPCDRREITYTGRVITVDLLGFMDFQGMYEAGRLIGVNVTSQGGMNDHLSDYTDPKNTYGQSKTTVLTLLRRFLDCGGVFFIAGYHRPDPKKDWRFEWRQITHAEIDACIARKRGPRKAP